MTLWCRRKTYTITGPFFWCVCVCMERCGIVHCFRSTECTHIDQRNYWLLIVRNIILSYIKSVVTSPHSGWQLIMRAGLISPGSAERGFGSGCALIPADRRTNEIEIIDLLGNCLAVFLCNLLSICRQNTNL